jgi:UDP-N-acetylmuramate dehydrogenase
VHAECGAMLSTIMKNTVKEDLAGFEFAAGIPGTVGGGIFMNAGANKGEIKDVVEEVTIWHKGSLQKLGLDQLSFEYRKCHLPVGSIITNAIFRLKKGNKEKSEKNIKEYLDYRNITQPVNLANTGSIFKNPENIAAGKLLEELGLKGEDIGGARFSELHANFIVNGGNAHASDVIKLIKKAQKMALEQRGITLETEVRIIE